MKLEYTVKNEESIKQVLKEKLHFSERLYKKVKNNIYINSVKQKHYIQIKPGDIISINMDFNETSDNIISNKNITFDILYEDEWMLIVNKKKNIPVHPSLNYYQNSLSNGVKSYFEQNNINKKIRIVNRLDKDTTGIVIFAKSEYIQDNLINYHKEYLAICNGELKGKGIINKSIARKNTSIIERCISENGQQAITHYEAIKNIHYNDKFVTLVKCILETGRTHQIRVHLASIGYPILGDSLYGVKDDLFKSQLLHAYKVVFTHPVSKKEIEIVAPLPDEMKKVIK